MEDREVQQVTNAVCDLRVACRGIFIIFIIYSLAFR